MRSRTDRNGAGSALTRLGFWAVMLLLYLASAGPADWAFERLPFDYDHPVSACLRAVYGPAAWLREGIPAYGSYLDRW